MIDIEISLQVLHCPLCLLRSIVPQILFYFILNCSFIQTAQLLICLGCKRILLFKNSNPSPKQSLTKEIDILRCATNIKSSFKTNSKNIFGKGYYQWCEYQVSQVSAFQRSLHSNLYSLDIFAKIAIFNCFKSIENAKTKEKLKFKLYLFP